MSAQTVFITGVSSGIGKALATSYLDRGWRVYGLSRREPRDLIERENFRFRSVDLAKLEEIDHELDVLMDAVRTLELVVLNAAVLGRIADMAETALVELKRLMDINLWANKVVLDWLRKRGIRVGQVVAISSGAANVAARGWGGYAISKAAMNMMIGLYAAEWPEVHFTALAPGIVDTAMQETISKMPVDERFPSVEALKRARGTRAMPPPGEAAGELIRVMERARGMPSGRYLEK